MGYKLRPIPDSTLAKIAVGMIYASIPILLIAVFLTRAAQITPVTGVIVIIVGVVLAVAAVAIAIVAGVEIWFRGYRGMAALFRVLGLASIVLAYPAYITILAIRLPPLHDISTDLVDPLVFSRSPAALAAREGIVPVATDLRHRDLQTRHYPAIKTLVIESEPEDALALIRDAALAIGLTIIEEVPPGAKGVPGRIEAIAQSRLLRFKDDVTIRIRFVGNETRVDMRSASRVGRHDFGTNAHRITRFFEEITANKD